MKSISIPALSAVCFPLVLSSCVAPLPPSTGGTGPPTGVSTGEAKAAADSPQFAPLVYSLGEGTTADGQSECSLSASAPSKSPLKREQMQFAVRRTGPNGWVVQRLLVQTGASKSQAELQSVLAAALRKSGGAAHGEELAKIGDIRFGGELRLLADGAGGTSFVYNPGLPEGNPTLSPEEGALFANLLSR